ncbi:MAG: hypothetical protein PHT51_04380 [Patescibacteria group bacterium]|nr:hypothetical protein [Patescibacteria group bacterium]MDD4610695.1 hypothetical protein [Patescibacteria group bacterium]
MLDKKTVPQEFVEAVDRYLATIKICWHLPQQGSEEARKVAQMARAVARADVENFLLPKWPTLTEELASLLKSYRFMRFLTFGPLAKNTIAALVENSKEDERFKCLLYLAQAMTEWPADSDHNEELVSWQRKLFGQLAKELPV